MRIVVNSHGYFGVGFCVSAMVIGNFMLLNLFLAILLKYIDDKAEETKVIIIADQKVELEQADLKRREESAAAHENDSFSSESLSNEFSNRSEESSSR